MATTGQAQEPSMEEILASIRQIISDEEGSADAGDDGAEAEAAPEAETVDNAEVDMSQDDLDKLFDADPEVEVEPADDDSGEDVLELTEDQVVDPMPQDDIDFVDDEPAAAPEVDFTEAERPPEPVLPKMPEPASGEALLSPGPDLEVAAAFSNLSTTLISHDSKTIEDIVREMLRPMLRNWLDDNLPPLVERLVRQEIERVSRGRG